MAKEIERKFLVTNQDWKKEATGTLYRQGYLSSVKERTVRVRIINDKAFITVKGANSGITRLEFEYEIPLNDATVMLDTLVEKPIIEKKRYKIKQGSLTWEIDEFLGDNAGLIVAEIELANEQQTFTKPAWIGQEVSDDQRYYNSNLVLNPYKNWASQ